MVFNNGLKGAECAVYSYLVEQADLKERISLADIAGATYYSYRAIHYAVSNLESAGHIRRVDSRCGWPHRFQICREAELA